MPYDRFTTEVLADTFEPHLICNRRKGRDEMRKYEFLHAGARGDQADLLSRRMAAEQMMSKAGIIASELIDAGEIHRFVDEQQLR